MQNYEKNELFSKLDNLECHINEQNIKQENNLNIAIEKDKSDSKEIYFIDVKEKEVVNKTLDSINFYDLINNISKELSDKSINHFKPSYKEKQPIQEDLAVESVIDRVNKIKP